MRFIWLDAALPAARLMRLPATEAVARLPEEDIESEVAQPQDGQGPDCAYKVEEREVITERWRRPLKEESGTTAAAR